jgi:hypothetical protein
MGYKHASETIDRRAWLKRPKMYSPLDKLTLSGFIFFLLTLPKTRFGNPAANLVGYNQQGKVYDRVNQADGG